MLYKSTAYALEKEPAEAIIVAGLMLLGFPLGVLSSRAAALGFSIVNRPRMTRRRCHRVEL